MTMQVFAVVLSHDQPESLDRVLDQLANQSVAPSRVLIVDTSKKEKISSHGFEVLKLNPKTSFAASIEAAVKHIAQDGYLWLLHDDSAPETNALEQLLREVELSPSLAVVGPKQVDWDNPKLIKQLGLTLTRSGKLFSRVRGEFDQGQHDGAQDVMAVGTAGALINLETYKAIGGFDQKAPPLAADVDFCIRARLQGARVAVAPNAKVSHKMLSMNGGRPASWLGGSAQSAIRHAELHIKLSYTNPLGFVLGWLFLIPISILSSLVLLLRKRAALVPAELAASLKTFLSLGNLVHSRNKINQTTTLKFKTLAGLRATRQEVKSSNQRARDQEITRALLQAHARGDNDELAVAGNQGVVASGALWWALGVLALNISWFPTNLAVSGSAVIPVSSNWLEIFSRAGSLDHDLGLGFVGAADPLVWSLAFLSSPLFFLPNLAITALMFLAMPIAFIGVFKLAGLITTGNAIRIASGLTFVLWPSFGFAIGQGSFTQLMAMALLPWLLLAIAKIAELGKLIPGEFVSVWSKVGTASILLALISSASPVLGATLIALIVILALIRPTKLLPLILTTGLTIAWFTPLVLERLSSGSWLSIFVDPGLESAKQFDQSWTLLFYGFSFDSLALNLLIVAPVVLLAVVALLAPKLKTTLLLWLVVLLSLVSAWFGAGVSFSFGADISQPLDISAVLALTALALVLLVAIVADASKPMQVIAISLVAVLGLAPAAFALATNPPELRYSDSRIVPSIIQADADAGSIWRTLKLESQEDGTIGAELFSGSGVKLDQLATGFRIYTANQATSDANYQELGQLVANLASANGAEIITSLRKFTIGYILVSPSNRDLQMALDSTGELESIGETDFGQLWKVRGVDPGSKNSNLSFDTAKIIQLAVLGLYLILAIPTGAARRRNSKESAIFVDAEENN